MRTNFILLGKNFNFEQETSMKANPKAKLVQRTVGLNKFVSFQLAWVSL